MSDFVDLKLIDKGDFYDIDFDDSGDFLTTNTLETAFITSLFTNRRATPTEIPSAYLRGGWWGNLFMPTPQGSVLWLAQQAVSNAATLASVISYVQDALQWMIDQEFADSINVTGSNNRGDIDITISVIKNGSKITEKVYNLWQNTLREFS